MEIDDRPIREFVKKHGMTGYDQPMQAGVIVEEAKEVIKAMLYRERHPVREEIADVVISAMVFAENGGWLDKLPGLIEEKMKINLEKPVRKKSGEKVRKY